MTRIDDYFKNQRIVIESLSFDYNRKRYFGKGILTWNPDQGFHLEAFIDNGRELPNSKVYPNKFGIPQKNECSSIRMKPQGYRWAITNQLYIYNFVDFFLSQWLSIDFSCLTLCEDISTNNSETHDLYWRGRALYQSYSRICLSDDRIITTEIPDSYQLSEKGIYGLHYQDQSQIIGGEMIEKKVLKLRWKQSKSCWTKTQTWQWPKLAQDALSIYYGETINLLAREIYRNSCRYIEYRAKRTLIDLRELSPLGHGSKPLNKFLFVQLTEFFTKNPNEAFICQSIFNQLVEASKQQTWQAKELLTATILEAALRTIENEPYQERQKYDPTTRLKLFREKYSLSRDWKTICKPYSGVVAQIYKDLRHRNAHPDWLYTESGYLSPEQRAKSLDNLIYLSRFYGYMILAIAGFSGIKPNFPTSHKEWASSIVIMDANEEEVKEELGEKTMDRFNYIRQWIEERNGDHS